MTRLNIPKTDDHIKEKMDTSAMELEQFFDADCVLYYGAITLGQADFFSRVIYNLQQENPPRKRLVINLHTGGGSAEAAEKMVDVSRYFYNEVIFIVPRYAMSAGTIFCMSGDKIYMDFGSSLGPIDPQVFNGKEFVPALGYLDQFNKLVQKSIDGTISAAEFQMLRDMDLGDLSRYEQASNLATSLIKKWLAEYKFKDWVAHSSTGKRVTEEDKKERAEQIAKMLGDNNLWYSHGRFIGIKTIQNILKLKVEDYSNDGPLREKILAYNDFAVHYFLQKSYPEFIHTKNCF